jgi:hypothetical protein
VLDVVSENVALSCVVRARMVADELVYKSVSLCGKRVAFL